MRGTTETTNSDQFGDTNINRTYINAVTNALVNNEHVSAEGITADNVPYPATAIFDPTTRTDYDGSVATGVANLTDDINRYNDCPAGNHPTLILIGYSQGAEVVKKTLNNIASTDSPDVNNIGAAINVADASRSNLPPAGRMFTVNPDWTPAPQPNAISGGLMDRIPVASPFADGRFFDICRTDDVVCNDPEPQRQLADFTAFFGASLIPATFPHERYADPAAMPVANQIAQQAAAAAEAQHSTTNPPPPPATTPPPATAPPASAPPSATVPPATVPPVTVPPVTVPPVTVPPVTTPPVTTPPVTTPPVTTPPVTVPPVTTPPVTTPPVTTPPPKNTPPPGSVAPPPPDKGVPGPTVHQEQAWGREMNIRRFATTDARVIYVLKGPSAVDVQCQVHGQRVIYGPYDNDGWSYLPAFGGWLSNIFISRNGMVPQVPDCGSTTAPRQRANVPRVQMPTSVTPAPEVLRPFQALTAPGQAPQPSQAPRSPQPQPSQAPVTPPAQTPTTPPQEPVAPVQIGNIGLP